ncbi:MAG: hypothetical protein AAGA75_23165 [Cyanobacteria bacterium P01_E01_bin.6]
MILVVDGDRRLLNLWLDQVVYNGSNPDLVSFVSDKGFQFI